MKVGALLLCLIWPVCAAAQDRDFTLTVPQDIEATGFLQHLLPRFALKYGVRITQLPEGGDAVIGAEGLPVFAGLGRVWHLSHNGAPGGLKFEDWLRSDIGKRTIGAFQTDGAAPFRAEGLVDIAVPDAIFEGDPVAGQRLSLHHCGRCHVVHESNRMKGIGQTPSFALLRTFEDWQSRFMRFYVLNPHPSFTQIEDITPPFNIRRPPAIVPLRITQNELEAILAYVAIIVPADLGAPLQSQ